MNAHPTNTNTNISAPTNAQRHIACCKKRASYLLGAFLVLLLCANLVPLGGAHTQLAWADNDSETADDTPKTAYQLQQDIEAAQASYLEARADADEAANNVSAHEEEITNIEDKLLPEQQKRTGEATRELYKLQQSSVGLIDLLLNAGSLHEFITHFEYISYITSKHRDELESLTSLKAELESSREELRAAQEAANTKASEAASALSAAKEAQAEAQRRVEEDALMQAQIAANAANLAESPRNNDSGSVADFAASDETSGNSSGAASGESDNNNSSEQDSGGNNGGSGAGASAGASSGSSAGAGSSAVQPPPAQNDSLAGWTARIDAYLAGSPMAGQGATFASAALANGIDPRFSPAIACLESSKGRFCFLPYNAWGWGSVSWSSWEEAINAHVRGLASIYGFAPTIEGAKMYCPPNWEHWYNTVCSQMALI